MLAQNESAAPHVLLAEDDDDMRALVALSLRQAGCEVTECIDGFKLLECLGSFLLPEYPDMYDLIVSDVRMPGVTGLEVLKAASRSHVFPPMILITAFGDQQMREHAHDSGAMGFLSKPFELDDLVQMVREVFLFTKPVAKS